MLHYIVSKKLREENNSLMRQEFLALSLYGFCIPGKISEAFCGNLGPIEWEKTGDPIFLSYFFHACPPLRLNVLYQFFFPVGLSN